MMRAMLAKRFMLFMLLWLVLSRGDAGGLVFGLVSAAAAAWISIRLLPPDQQPTRVLGLIGMLPGFLRRSLTGGVDVARRALDPRLPIAPGWIAYRTRLPKGLPRATFGSETSLLPGSLVAGGQGNTLYVHCLDTRQDVQQTLRAEEQRVSRVFGRRPGKPTASAAAAHPPTDEGPPR